ncbi:hypothetical protein LINPERPRIM_LOCUS20596 [Linum perenne]
MRREMFFRMQSIDFVYVTYGPIFKGQSDVTNKPRNSCGW